MDDLHQPHRCPLVVLCNLLHPTGWALLLPPAVQLLVWGTQKHRVSRAKSSPDGKMHGKRKNEQNSDPVERWIVGRLC